MDLLAEELKYIRFCTAGNYQGQPPFFLLLHLSLPPPAAMVSVELSVLCVHHTWLPTLTCQPIPQAYWSLQKVTFYPCV